MSKIALRKPSWIKSQIPSGKNYYFIKALLKNLKLATVCESASCPNIGECWNGGTATLMLMGGHLHTRLSAFAMLKQDSLKAGWTKKSRKKWLSALSQLNLNYVVLTSVDRDDLEDEGSGHFAKNRTDSKKKNCLTF